MPLRSLRAAVEGLRPHPPPRPQIAGGARSSGRCIAARLYGDSVDRFTRFKTRGSTAPADPG
eukprot:4942291-Prymnesium_polylepis.1